MVREIRFLPEPDDRPERDKEDLGTQQTRRRRPCSNAPCLKSSSAALVPAASGTAGAAGVPGLRFRGQNGPRPPKQLTRDNRAFLAPQDGGDLHVGPTTPTGGLDAAGGQRAGDAAHAADAARL